ncbi:16S rRNA (cytosine(967)-C(5))-methyltransferase RsmB [Thermomonas sp. HDW16]|uniref:16S rRNA (cytosine(967)-C(5))-methyltransferase RsmB n=1 Tax=Thermomonas sp. HDW16 TaxID=2714945 RepID=UPI00140C2896|nr:16S rRNA (cytosine(967)-C(5))-methyltransferase RsmB [Thermomonas sp. HDW16]QIL19304.1 16S rRNA (cytosine(967)-C(5))-methyltransferase RsmB [Thermomonas sp. HDW16]
MSAGVATRVAAARVLDEVLHRGRSLKASLGAALPALPDPRDRALVEAIVFAALRQRARFDAALSLWLAKPLGQRDHELRALLHAGFAQLSLGMPEHAVLDATVEAARALRRPHQAGMVNAVLRRAQRDGLPQAMPGDAWPAWLAQRIRVDWPQHADAIFAASAEEAPMWLRVHARATTRDGYLERLQEAGIEVDVDPDLPDAIRLAASLPVQQLPGFDEGVVSVQDGAAQRVADALSPRPRARVLDACAAPGGKSAHLAERDPSLCITALDIDPRRVRRMQDTFARLKLGIDARVADATQPQAWWDGTPFDAILLDAPCSATGIVRRQPDVLLHRRENDIVALVDTQAKLLDASWPMLASGGTLLYATCSILREENAAQIEAFLARTPDARLELLDESFGHDTGFGSQRFPGEAGMDGFFYARLRKA